MVLPKLSNIRDSFPNYSWVPLRERKRTYLALPLGCETLGGSGVELERSVGCMHSCPGESWWELSKKVWRKWRARDKSEIRRCKKKSLAVRLDTWEQRVNIRPEFVLPIKVTLASSSSKLVFCFCVWETYWVIIKWKVSCLARPHYWLQKWPHVKCMCSRKTSYRPQTPASKQKPHFSHRDCDSCNQQCLF